MADNQVDLKLNLDFQGVNDALYQMIGQFNGTDKEFQKITDMVNQEKLMVTPLAYIRGRSLSNIIFIINMNSRFSRIWKNKINI